MQFLPSNNEVENMKKVYQHKFKDGQCVTLTCDLSKELLGMNARPFGVVNQHRKEYKQWLDTVVLPDLMNNLTPRQLMTIAVHNMTQNNPPSADGKK